jgi:uncharacterized membrane protein YhaH (DUF805 family)
MRLSFRFLYRESEGAIGPGLWARASALPVGVALIMTLIAWVVAPRVPRDLGSQPFFSFTIFAVHFYLIIYSFALIFLAVAQYFVSAKRFTDLGKSPAWAGLTPFCLLLAAAANWFQPRSEEAMPVWAVYPFDALALAVVIWNIVELGFIERPSTS